jgi:Uma2 family endonuclease
VLSPSTERFDRGEKFELYRRIPSLQSYVLVSQSSVLVQSFDRRSEDQWLLTAMVSPSSELNLPFVNVSIRLSDIYDRVKFEIEAGYRAPETSV